MGSLIGHSMSYIRLEFLKGQRHIPNANSFLPPPPPLLNLNLVMQYLSRVWKRVYKGHVIEAKISKWRVNITEADVIRKLFISVRRYLPHEINVIRWFLLSFCQNLNISLKTWTQEWDLKLSLLKTWCGDEFPCYIYPLSILINQQVDKIVQR